MANKPLTHMRKPFLYGGKWLFRLRISEHAAQRVRKRGKDGTLTVTSFMSSFSKVLEETTALTKLPKPQAGESYVFFIQKTSEIVFVLFASMEPGTVPPKRPIELNVIVETYLVPFSKSHFLKIRTADRDKCIAILEDGIVVPGKHNDWFV